MIIYKVTNKINKKIYIGQTIRSMTERKYGHIKSVRMGSTSLFHNSIRKYGIDNFTWEVIDTAHCIEKLNELEISYIAKFNCFIDFQNSNGYNMNTGGGNYITSHLTKQKLSIINTGKILSTETKEKISKGNLGKSVTESFRKTMSELNKGRVASLETREKISKSLQGKPGRNTGNTHTQETKEKISNTKKGTVSWNASPVIQLTMDGEFVREWRSAAFAASQLKLSQGNITSCIHGKRNSTGNYKWIKKI